MPVISMHRLYQVIYDPIFLSAFSSWFIAQFIKTVIEIFKVKKARKSKDLVGVLLWTTGGMPSSHSSLVTSIATSIAFKEGVTSPLFMCMLFYGAIIVRDAVGVRRSSGIQARLINTISWELNKKFDMNLKPVKEVHGHSIPEVTVGIILGFFISVAFFNL